MNSVGLAKAIAGDTGVPKPMVRRVLKSMALIVAYYVAQGDPVSVANLGKFRRRTTKAKIGRNPRNGQPIRIAAKHVPAFTPAKYLKELVITGVDQDA